MIQLYNQWQLFTISITYSYFFSVSR